jgi:pseudouridylate synthase
MMSSPVDVSSEVTEAFTAGRPVVALESTLIAHGLPWPLNLETAREAEATIRSEGAIPATIGVWEGRPTVGLNPEQIEALAQRRDVLKASRRDLATAVAQGRTAATTVAATMVLAHRAGIRVFATGGIGGVHRGVEQTGDVSADLPELARTPVAVVCAGAKSILDLPRTLEMLETLGVPVVGYGTDEFPAFYLQSSGDRISARVDTPKEAAALLSAHWALGGAGVVVAQALAAEVALNHDEWQEALHRAEREAAVRGVRGKEVTPFLLSSLAEITGGKTLRANRELIVANARLAAQIARELPSSVSRDHHASAGHR